MIIISSDLQKDSVLLEIKDPITLKSTKLFFIMRTVIFIFNTFISTILIAICIIGAKYKGIYDNSSFIDITMFSIQIFRFLFVLPLFIFFFKANIKHKKVLMVVSIFFICFYFFQVIHSVSKILYIINSHKNGKKIYPCIFCVYKEICLISCLFIIFYSAFCLLLMLLPQKYDGSFYKISLLLPQYIFAFIVLFLHLLINVITSIIEE